MSNFRVGGCPCWRLTDQMANLVFGLRISSDIDLSTDVQITIDSRTHQLFLLHGKAEHIALNLDLVRDNPVSG
jgi:hypothetical protein